MSLTIENEKFTIFGSGYEQTRNDSGEGMPEPDIHLLNGINYGAIDETGEFVWLSDGGNIYKFRIRPWENVGHSIGSGSVFHPCNVENNIGLASATSTNKVFNLTTGEVIKTIESGGGFSGWKCDSILVDDAIYLNIRNTQRNGLSLYKVDIENETVSLMLDEYNRLGCGFVDDDTIYSVFQAEWFSDYTRIYGYGFSGGVQWSGVSTDEDRLFSKVDTSNGICGNGFIFVPSLVEGKWRLGMYGGNSTPDFLTPTPIKTIGEFASKPSLEWQFRNVDICFNQGKTKCAFATSIGTFYTDFDKKLVKLSDTPSDFIPLAMDDHTIVGRRGNNQIVVQRI